MATLTTNTSSIVINTKAYESIIEEKNGGALQIYCFSTKINVKNIERTNQKIAIKQKR
jgi:hypothetical protein